MCPSAQRPGPADMRCLWLRRMPFSSGRVGHSRDGLRSLWPFCRVGLQNQAPSPEKPVIESTQLPEQAARSFGRTDETRRLANLTATTIQEFSMPIHRLATIVALMASLAAGSAAAESQKVNAASFIRAESDTYMRNLAAQAGGLGVLNSTRARRRSSPTSSRRARTSTSTTSRPRSSR